MAPSPCPSVWAVSERRRGRFALVWRMPWNPMLVRVAVYDGETEVYGYDTTRDGAVQMLKSDESIVLRGG